jgi:hypothetical protein
VGGSCPWAVRVVWPDVIRQPLYHLLGYARHVHREAATEPGLAGEIGALRPRSGCDTARATQLDVEVRGVRRLACVRYHQRWGAAVLGRR